jgi:hypothetical protein
MSNIVSLSEARRQKDNRDGGRVEIDAEIAEVYFEDAMRHNERVKERRKKEIAQANKAVLRSYKIKY